MLGTDPKRTGINDDEPDERCKRRKSTHSWTTMKSIYEPQLPVLHRVRCAQTKDHANHVALAHYFDAPRLFEGDSKASTLRGKVKIPDVEAYLQARSDVSITTYKNYSCEDYYKDLEDQFEALQKPKDPDVRHLEPYFFRLRKDANEAIPYSEWITIVPSDLRSAITSITGIDPKVLVHLDDLNNMEIFRYHLYHWKDTIAEALRTETRVREQHIAALSKYMVRRYGSEYEEAADLFQRHQVTRTHLSKLFGPGELVVTFQNGQPLVYMSDNCRQPYRHPLALNCWSWKFDRVFWKEKKVLHVSWPSTETEVDISDLGIYPLRYATSDLQERIKRRGEIFWECRIKKHVHYSPPNPRSMQLNMRYMVDMETYQQMMLGQDTAEQSSEREELDRDAMELDQPPDEDFPLLLPADILGFGFHDRKWRKLLVEHIDDIRWNDKAFERLVIGPTDKDLIKALVDAHTSRSTSNMGNTANDVIEGKGNGLIILLHGGPGTGKTLTAESVAEVSRRPLYRITCGDIGTSADEIEKNLPDVLLFGTIWGCVLLLDEADVFLEERSEQDLQRNALVSVFLRAIEYYDGILILTSNRVGTFDEAFVSRIQLALHLPRLKKENRFHIWNNFFENLRETNVNANVDQLKAKIRDLSKHKLNGREIRNIVKVAQQLAQSREQRLEYRHFKQVVDVSIKFGKYLTEEHGHDPSQWAREQGRRSAAD